MKFKISDIAAGKIVATAQPIYLALHDANPKSVVGKVDGKSCTLEFQRTSDADKVNIESGGAETCMDLWARADFANPFAFIPDIPAEAPYRLQLSMDPAPTAGAVTLEFKDGVPLQKGGGELNEIWFLTERTGELPWKRLDGVQKRDADQLQGSRFVRDNGDNVQSGTLNVESPPSGQTPEERGNGNEDASAGPMDCDSNSGLARETQIICVDLANSEGDQRVMFNPRHGTVLRPNQDVLVRVRHPVGYGIEISMGGERGLYEAPVRDNAEVMKAQSSSGALKVSQVTTTEKLFSPRKPGDADVTIKMKDSAGKETTQKVELVVDKTYSGAVRIGVGFPFGDAFRNEYEAQTMPGSQQQEVVGTKFGATELELTVGYSAYVWEPEGRSMIRGCHPWCHNPFIALGVVDPSADGLDFFRSVYVGYEWEPQPSISFGIAVVARRVTELGDGVEIGSPIDGDVPTKEGFGFGGGVVVNFSPEFLRIAKPAAGNFLQ